MSNSNATQVKVKPPVTVMGTNWKWFTGEELPQSGIDFLDRIEALKYPGGYYTNLVYYQGDSPETATKWLFVTANGGFYKVNAIHSIWFTKNDGREVMQCIWSDTYLKKSLRNILKTGEFIIDPGYTT